MTYFGINLTKDVQNLNTEHSKTLLRKITKELDKWREIVGSWIKTPLLSFSSQIGLWVQHNLIKTPVSLLKANFIQLHSYSSVQN